MTDKKPSAVKLYRGFKDQGLYTVSPYVTKLELRFRMGDVPYVTDAGSPVSSPNGKVPYIDVGPLFGEEQPRLIGDSSLIADFMVEEGRLHDLNDGLSKQEQLADMGIKALLENKLYFLNIRERWIDNYYTQRDTVLWSMPYPVRVILGLIIHRKNKKMLEALGTARFTSEQALAMVESTWETIAASLEESRRNAKNGQPFWLLGGAQATDADTTLFGFIISALITPSGPKQAEIVRGLPVLLEYLERIHDEYFPDYKKSW